MNDGLEIAMFGSSLVSAYWNGAATYYRGIIRALASRGHRITFYEPDAFERQQHRDMSDPSWAKVVVYEPNEQAAQSCLERAGKADVVIKASGVGVLDGFLENGILELKQPAKRIMFWDVDAPATLERVHNDPADPFADFIPQYDSILTYGGGKPVVDAYRKLGARACFPIYNALDISSHHPVPPEEKFTADLAFLGNRLPDREARVEEFFLTPATMMPNRRFLLGGNGWDGKPLSKNVISLGHVYTREHNAFNCTPLAVLNINRQSMADCGFSPATRVFEAAGAGACIITDYWKGIEQFLKPDDEILVANSGADVVKLLNWLTPDRARDIGQKARTRVLSEHTYEHRAQQLHSILLIGGANGG